ncbi:hypothetical protein EDM80_01360 [bacterium]|nr:MAG: hypothetical protein EDM80_01360 [bacterium]RIK62117.1 MAG: hypothetical protein DCC64_11435 [Planctomycetota bacterium]
MAVHIGIEMSRDLRLAAGRLVPPGTLAAGGVNLLRHALGLAARLTGPESISVLTIEPDETVLELVAEAGCREAGAMQWVATLADLAKAAGPGDAALILRQTAPMRDESALRSALEMLKVHRCVTGVSRPPEGFWASRAKPGVPQPEPYVVRCFEAWRLAEFGKYGFSGPTAEMPLLELDWDSFVEIDRPEDFERAARLLRR